MIPKRPKVDELVLALDRVFSTPNESDSNLETPANIADGAFAVARSLSEIARAIERFNCGSQGHIDPGQYGDGRCRRCGMPIEAGK